MLPQKWSDAEYQT